MIPEDLRLQIRADRRITGGNVPGYRFARTNGWSCCGGWHSHISTAAKCLTDRLKATKRSA